MISPTLRRVRNRAGTKMRNPTPPTSRMRALSSIWEISPRSVAIIFRFYRKYRRDDQLVVPTSLTISSCIQVRDRDRQRVSGIIRFGDGIKLKQGTHHVLYLTFVCTSITRNGLFYFIRRVFRRFNSRLLHAQHHHTARLPHSDGRSHIAGEE